MRIRLWMLRQCLDFPEIKDHYLAADDFIMWVFGIQKSHDQPYKIPKNANSGREYTYIRPKFEVEIEWNEIAGEPISKENIDRLAKKMIRQMEEDVFLGLSNAEFYRATK